MRFIKAWNIKLSTPAVINVGCVTRITRGNFGPILESLPSYLLLHMVKYTK